MLNLNVNLTVTVFVTSDAASSERRFDKGLTIGALKEKLEPITGISSTWMKLQLYSKTDVLLAVMDDDSKMLGMYPIDDLMRIHVINTNPSRVQGEFTDLSLVDKYVMPESEYEKRTDSVRSFLQRNKLGKYAEVDQEELERQQEEFKDEASKINLNDRCLVETSDEGLKKRGTVMFVGKTDFKPGYWVGIKYDEPIGKNNGRKVDFNTSVSGKKYFECPNKYGAFVRPNKLVVGDYPEEEIDLDDLDEF